MADRVEVYVDGHWCELVDDDPIGTIEAALGVYARIVHPELGECWLVPHCYPMRGPVSAPASSIVIPGQIQIPG